MLAEWPCVGIGGKALNQGPQMINPPNDQSPQRERLPKSNLETPSLDVMAPRHDFSVMSLEQLEKVIEDNVPAFVQVGLALRSIRDGKLFKPKFTRFEDYCRSKWGFCRQTGHRSIEASEIALELSPIGNTEGAVWNESQLRPLAKLTDPQLRRDAFQMAIESSATKRPTANQVKAAVNEILLRQRINNRQNADSNSSYEANDRVRIIKGDAADRGLLPAGTVNVVIGSPPYNVGVEYPNVDDTLEPQDYLKKVSSWLSNCYYWLIPEGGRLCLNLPVDTRKYGPFPIATEVTKIAQDVGFAYEATIIWDEASHRGRWNQMDAVASPLIMCRCEVILLFSKGGMVRPNASQLRDITHDEVRDWSSGYWRFPGAHRTNQHPCPFPAELPRRLIKLLSYPTDLILDPWAGTGTTLIEAIKLNRRAVGIDIEPSYCALMQKRSTACLQSTAS